MSFRDVFNDKSREVYKLAVENGWYDDAPRSPLEIHMLIVGEIAEASEEVRRREPPAYYASSVNAFSRIDHRSDERPGKKPEGELIELADAVLRIMDYCASKDWDLGAAIEIKHRYNQTRAYRHGNKKY